VPSTVGRVFSAAGLERDGVVRWGQAAGDDRSGIYVVALTDREDALAGTLPAPPIDAAAIHELLVVRAELTLDGRRPSAAELAARISAFWLADESILYIGLATSLRSRVRSFYRTAIGARRPHSGGWFLKTLANLDELYVHYARTPDFDTAEPLMLEAFVAAVSPEARASLHDPDHAWPFANLEIRRGGRKSRKRHGIKGARGDVTLVAPRARPTLHPWSS
jgi:hypothetical protein